MPALAEVQTRIRDALLQGGGGHAIPSLIGGTCPAKRFAIHQRHYEASLVAALLTKFPACLWLMGGSRMTEAARAFVHERAPRVPCIAEYGAEFPSFLASRPEALGVAYLQSFAELEWHLGRVAIAIEHPAASMHVLASVDRQLLPDIVFELQPCVTYFQGAWPVDELIKLFLSGTAPDRVEFEPTPVALELRGARGSFNITRIDTGTFAFRAAIAAGTPIGMAAERAFEANAHFDPGRALARLVADGLVMGVAAPRAGVSA
jgi:hypothetical protein